MRKEIDEKKEKISEVLSEEHMTVLIQYETKKLLECINERKKFEKEFKDHSASESYSDEIRAYDAETIQIITELKNVLEVLKIFQLPDEQTT